MKETLPEESQSGARVVLWLFGDILCAAKITQLQCLKQAWMVLVCGAKSNNQRGGQTASPMAMVGDQEMELPWSDFNSESSLLWRLRVESHFLSCAWKASSAKQIGPVQTFQMRRLSVRPLCKILAQREHSIHIVVHQDYLEERAVPHHNSDQALETYCKTSYIEIVLLTYCFCTNTSSRSKKDGGLRNVTAFFTWQQMEGKGKGRRNKVWPQNSHIQWDS